MSADAVHSLLQPNTADYNKKVPVEHLDYDYIEKCKDVKYLEKILRALRYSKNYNTKLLEGIDFFL